MEPSELRMIMVMLECRTCVALGQLIGVERSTVSSWRRGEIGVPRHVAMLLRMLVDDLG